MQRCDGLLLGAARSAPSPASMTATSDVWVRFLRRWAPSNAGVRGWLRTHRRLRGGTRSSLVDVAEARTPASSASPLKHASPPYAWRAGERTQSGGRCDEARACRPLALAAASRAGCHCGFNSAARSWWRLRYSGRTLMSRAFGRYSIIDADARTSGTDRGTVIEQIRSYPRRWDSTLHKIRDERTRDLEAGMRRSVVDLFGSQAFEIGRC